MDQQETLQTSADDVTCVASETLESSSATEHYTPKNPKRISAAIPLRHYGRRMKLNCRHGYNILIFDNGTVSTSDDDTDNHCVLEFTSMAPGQVRIKGVEANLFLAMNENGQLYGEPDPLQKSTLFIELSDGPYSVYLSLKYKKKKWFVGIKKNGKIKSGPETRRGQHATNFLPVPIAH